MSGLRNRKHVRDRELDARRQLDDAYARDMERERRTFDEMHHQREDACKQRKEVYAQLRDCMQQARSDLEESAALREQAAALKAELHILRAAAAAATVPTAEPTTTSVDVPGSAPAVHQTSTTVSVCAPPVIRHELAAVNAQQYKYSTINVSTANSELPSVSTYPASAHVTYTVGSQPHPAQFVDASIIPHPSSAVYTQSSMHPASVPAARVIDSQYLDTGNALSPYAVQPSATTVVSQPTDLTSTHLACTHAQLGHPTTVVQAQPTLPPVPTSFVQLQPPRHIPLVEVGATVCTPAVQAPLTYNPVQCLVGQTLSSVSAPVHSSAVGATTDASALPTVALTVQCTDSTLKHETVLSQGAVATTVAPVKEYVPNITSNTTTTTSTSGSRVNTAPPAVSSIPAPVVFKQLTQPRAYNGTTSWKDYRAHFERVCKVNG